MSTSREDSNLLQEQVEEGLTRAYKKLIAFKKRMNSPLIISQNGKVVAIPAEELANTSNS